MAGTSPLKICVATAEFAPLAKTGGLADVCASLATCLHRRGHDVRVLLPFYSTIDTHLLRVAPLPGLQDLETRLGTRRLRYSIDAARLPGNGLPVHLLRCPEFYDRPGIYTEDSDEHLRFALLSQAALAMCQHTHFAPDIVHCHDWHAALLPLYLKTVYAWDRLFAHTRSCLTLHNVGYQGIFPAASLPELGLAGAERELPGEDLARGQVNFLKAGVLHADLLTTVSPGYAREIRMPQYGMGLEELLRARSGSLVGILNGIDYREWNPETDPLIPCTYSRHRPGGKQSCKLRLLAELGLAEEPATPLVGMVSRLVSQKGIELVQQAIPPLLGERRFAMAVLGSGEPAYESFFAELERAFPGRVAFRRGYDNALAHRIEAGSDMFLMPSLYEPCGLNQMYSLRYGTVPVVRMTGGLADSVSHFDAASGRGDGIVFRDYDANGLRWALETALALYADRRRWRRAMQNGMRKDFSLERQCRSYEERFVGLAASARRIAPPAPPADRPPSGSSSSAGGSTPSSP